MSFRILIIDDSEVLLARMQRVLSAEGYEVTVTTQVIGNARHIPTSDLVIIDYHMPGIDGATVVKSLKSAAGATHRCLFYLYTSDKEVTAEYAQLGFDGVITAKGDDEALRSQVSAIARISQMRALARRPPK